MESKLKWTGERYIPCIDPQVCGVEIHYEHLHRYAFASQFVDGKKVLDLACGEGYGSYMLSQKAALVVGIDIDHESVNNARINYLRYNLEFIEGSILDIPINGRNLFDVIVCFEAIEHISEHDKLFSEIKRLLKDDGLLIISTPNKKIYSDDANYHNPFHIKELYFHEFNEILHNNFSNVFLFGQKVYTSSNIWSLSPNERQYCNEYIISKDNGKFSFVNENIKTPLYLIAIASNIDLNEQYNFNSYLIDVSNTLLDIANAQILTLKQKISENNLKMSMLESQYKEAQEQIIYLNRNISERDAQISTLKQKISENNLKMSMLESQYKEAQEQIIYLNRNISERDAQISTLNLELHDASIKVKALEHELNDMKRSVVWQLMMKYHNGIVERLLPQRTRRRGAYDLFLKSCRILINEGWDSFWRQYKERKIVKRIEREATINNHNQDTSIINLNDWNGEKIIFPATTENVDVSIIIPVFNKSKYTYNCLCSLQKNTNGSFEIIVVNDASNDDTNKLLQNIDNIIYIKNEHNIGFIQSCNKGAAIAKGRYLLFLNNDTVVLEHWLEPMLDVIKNKDVGAVGAKLIYPDGKLQEAGGIIWNDSTGWNYGRGDDPDKPEYNFVREVDYCSGAALMVKKDIFDKCGGFNVLFKPAYYEDTDLCFSIRKMGYKVLYQPKSKIIHFEGITSGTDVRMGVKRYQETNKDKFWDKWHDTLLTDHHRPDSTILFLARNRKKGKNILVIDHYVPMFDKDSGSYRMYNFLKILSELGHKVTFIGDNLAKFEPYTSILQQEGIEVIYGPYIKSIEEYLSINGKFFDIVILSRAHIASNHILTVRKHCRQAKIIFDTVDLQFLREERRAKIEGDKSILDEAKRLKEIEFRLMEMSDVTLVVSPIEKEIIEKENPRIKVEIISNIHEVKGTKTPFSERKDIMFVGSYIHPPNADAVKWFVKEIFPIVKEKISGVKFYACGSDPGEDIKSLASEDVIITGYVKDLEPYFEKCRVFVAPLRYGAGIKGKINQSMSYGLPVVTTSIGAEGMGLLDGNNVLIADDANEFANKVVELYEDKQLWNKLSVNSIENVRLNYSYEVAREKIISLISSLEMHGGIEKFDHHHIKQEQIKETSR